jgi:SAM-dependent methyltransferase
MSAKWDTYYCSPGGPPWESGAPVSQVVEAIESGLLPSSHVGGAKRASAALEVGCGTGATTRFLVRHFSRVMGLDISAVALKLAREREVAEFASKDSTTSVDWRQLDVLDDAICSPFYASFDVVVDVQTFHAIAKVVAPSVVVATSIAAFLRPGGRLLVMTGSADEPQRLDPGPTLMSRDEVVGPFVAAGLLLVSIRSSRFDRTPAYGDAPPLAWVAVFIKP